MAAAPAAPRIFVSYARSDGKEIAVELRRRLKDDHGFPLWQDLADMEGGKDWWQQITEAIDHVEFVVLVMTSAALGSEYVRREWRYARQQGRCVIPVIGAQGIDFESLPGWMKRAHFVDPDEPDQWRRFVRTLEAPCKATRAPFMVENLPEVFVRRPRELDQLVASLLDRADEEPVAITAALKGAGGYGKTTLARAICHEEAIQNAFDDGVLWVTLGEQPGDVQSRVVDLIEVLTGERPGFKTTDAAITRFGEVVGERRMLIVIDDVWQAAHARPFLQVGRNCARLITTRNRDVLPPNAKPLDVDAMAPNEAIRLLRFGLPDGEDAAFARLAQRLGEWPLLLKLVNGALHKRLAAGQPLAAALARVNAGLDSRGLTVFDARDPVERGDAVAKTLGVSLELFTEDERVRFAELAIFPEDVDLPLAVVETVWSRTAGFDDFDTEALCTRLYDQSLLLSLDLATRRIRLHDVIRAWLQAGQKERLPALHAELVEAYRARCADGWHTGPDDGYFFQYLPYHLAEAGRANERRALLFDYLWLRRKLEVAGVNRLIEDFVPLHDDAEARKLAGALRLSAHILNHQPRQLASQLLGRLSSADGPVIGTLLGTARIHADRPSLAPLRRSLTPPGGPLLATLEGHGDCVWAVAVTPDGRRVISGSADETLKVWDLDEGALLATLEGHGAGVRAVAVTPDGRRAVSGSGDGTLKLWDLEQGTLLATLEGHCAGVTAVAVTPNGRRAVSGSDDATLRVWDLEQGTLLVTLEGHGAEVRALAVTADGQRMISGSAGRLDSAGQGFATYSATLAVWDLEQGALLSTLAGHGAGVSAVAVTPDGRRAVSGSSDALKVWDLEQGRLLSTLEGHGAGVLAVGVTPDGRRAVSGSDDATLKVWDLERGMLLATLKGHGDKVRGVAVTPDGRRAVSGSDDQTLKVWDLKQGAALATPEGHDAWVTAVAVTPDGRRAVSGSDDGTLKVWNPEQGTLLATLEGHGARVTAVVVTPGGQRAVSGSANWGYRDQSFVPCSETLKVWDLEKASLLAALEGDGAEIRALAVTPNGRRAVSGSAGAVYWNPQGFATYSATLAVWDLEQGALMATLEGHPAGITALAVTPDGRRAVSGSADRTLKVWDLEQGTLMATMKGHGVVSVVTVIPNGRRALSGSGDGTLEVWNLHHGTRLATLEGHGAEVRAVAVTPDGRRAISGSYRTLKVWDLEQASLLATLKGHDDWVRAVAVSADGRHAISGSGDATLRVWDLATGRELAAFTGDAQVSCCAFTPDGRFAVVGDARGQIHLLEILL